MRPRAARLPTESEIVRNALSLAIQSTKADGAFPVSVLMKVPGFTAAKVPIMIKAGWIEPIISKARKSPRYRATRLATFELRSLERSKHAEYSSEQFKRMVELGL